MQLFLELQQSFDLSQSDVENLPFNEANNGLLDNFRKLKLLVPEDSLHQLAKADIINICNNFEHFARNFELLDKLKRATFLKYKNMKLLSFLANDLKAEYSEESQIHLHDYIDVCLPHSHKMINLPLAVFG